jgi:predicted O-linked N-acetylglucosamine transferase (SPINDLY family)
MKRSNAADPDVTAILALMARGELAALDAPSARLLRRDRTHPVGIKARSAYLIGQGRQQEALPLLGQGTRHHPGDAEMWNNLGIVLSDLGRHDEAVAQFRRALRIAPGQADPLANLANALLKCGTLEGAIAAARQAAAADPGHPQAFNTLGAALLRAGDKEAALEALSAAVSNSPESLAVFGNFVTALLELRRYADAVRCLRPALEVGAADAAERDALLPLLCRAQRAICDWERAEALPAALTDLVRRGVEPGPEPFFLTHVEDIDPATQRRCAENYGRAYLAGVFGGALPPPLCAAAAGNDDMIPRPLRIGFLSADFRAHAVSELAVGVFEAFDRTAFAVHGYAYGPDDPGPLRRRLVEAFDVFRDIDALSFADAARCIHDDGIDVLVDMAGWTGESRMAITAYRPAPVIAHWLGFPGTLGLPGCIDYLISDARVTPPDRAADYAERLALMPHSYQPSSRAAVSRPRPTRAEAGLPQDAFVFASFNQSVKITPQVFGLWCELLRRNPGAVLWLGFQDEAAQENLRREALARGIDTARLVFAPWAAVERHWDRLGLADLALDTFPYGGHATASDMLWAGVPLVAWAGTAFASRVAAGLVRAVGLPELVAGSAEDYLALADGLAKAPGRLAELRQRLQAARSVSPLYDTRRFADGFGRLLQAMWVARGDGSSAPVTVDSE